MAPTLLVLPSVDATLSMADWPTVTCVLAPLSTAALLRLWEFLVVVMPLLLLARAHTAAVVILLPDIMEKVEVVPLANIPAVHQAALLLLQTIAARAIAAAVVALS